MIIRGGRNGMPYIVLAFILGVLVCALIIYISNLKETIKRQQEQIVDMENQLRELLLERTGRDSLH
jgi:uncharacterized protein YoxC